jgi:hypothetical protein
MVDCFDVWQEHKVFYARGAKLERNLKLKLKQVSKKYVVNLCGGVNYAKSKLLKISLRKKVYDIL